MENIEKHGVLPIPVVNTREHESAPLCLLCAVSVEKKSRKSGHHMSRVAQLVSALILDCFTGNNIHTVPGSPYII